MSKLLLAFVIMLCVFLPAFGWSGWVISDLTKRENIKDVKVTYQDWETKTFFESEVKWGTKGWPSEKNPFGNSDTMNLKEFLDTFELLIPIGGYKGGKCKELDYRVSGGLIISAAHSCTVNYNMYGKIWSLTMMVVGFTMGNAIEEASISSDFLVGISVK